MHKRHHAQRQHIIHALDTLLYQLHALSFFLSPSLWTFVCRLIAQFQLSKPREVDSSRSLRFLYIMVFLFNASSVWAHVAQGATEGRAVVLDFVGLANVPSKMRLLFLDFLIIFLQLLLTTVAYETSLSNAAPADTPDNLLPLPLTSYSPLPLLASPSSPTMGDPTKLFATDISAFVIDVRITPILSRLRSTAPIPHQNVTDLLPLPNTTQWPLPTSLRMLIRARAEMRRRTDALPTADASPSRGLPGTMDVG